MDPSRILIQLDPDRHASVFDAVVAADAGVMHLLQYAGVHVDDVRDLVYGAIFTRGPKDLKSTAIFVGGRDVAAGELLLSAVRDTFFGPMRVSVMLDANGANTTAAAAVIALLRHARPPQPIVVLAATGSVGRRVARLAAGVGFAVRLVSRSLSRAQAACGEIEQQLDALKSLPVARGSLSAHAIDADSDTDPQLSPLLADAQAVIAAGAPGIQLIGKSQRQSASHVAVWIDLNAVPPLGIDGVQSADHGVQLEQAHAYGALGIGRLKMQLHRTALQQLFSTNQHVLDAEEILELGRTLSDDNAH